MIRGRLVSRRKNPRLLLLQHQQRTGFSSLIPSTANNKNAMVMRSAATNTSGNEKYGFAYRAILRMITAFRYRGHYAAKLDPLSLGFNKAKFLSEYGGNPDVIQLLERYDPEAAVPDLDFGRFTDPEKELPMRAIQHLELFSLQNDIKQDDTRFVPEKVR
jgi:hypothetical protein